MSEQEFYKFRYLLYQIIETLEWYRQEKEAYTGETFPDISIQDLKKFITGPITKEWHIKIFFPEWLTEYNELQERRRKEG